MKVAIVASRANWRSSGEHGQALEPVKLDTGGARGLFDRCRAPVDRESAARLDRAGYRDGAERPDDTGQLGADQDGDEHRER